MKPKKYRHTLFLLCFSLLSFADTAVFINLRSGSFAGGSVGKESACSEEDSGSIPGLGRSPGERNGNPLQYSCLENPHGQRSLVGYSLWGHTYVTRVTYGVGLWGRHDWANKHTRNLQAGLLDAIFPMVFAYLMSLCHILVIIKYSNLLHYYICYVICDQWSLM